MYQKLILASIALMAVLPGCNQQSPANTEPNKAAVEPIRPDIKDIAGIELGKAMVIPECRKEEYHYSIVYATDNASYPCFKNSLGAGNSLKTKADLPHGPKYDFSWAIELGSAAVPAGVSSAAFIWMIDGTPENIILETGGLEEQERLYALLVAKYGTPTRSNISQMQNAMGARYQAIEASWGLRSMTVRFYGMFDNPKKGAITASTPKAEQRCLDTQPKTSKAF